MGVPTSQRSVCFVLCMERVLYVLLGVRRVRAVDRRGVGRMIFGAAKSHVCRSPAGRERGLVGHTISVHSPTNLCCKI